MAKTWIYQERINADKLNDNLSTVLQEIYDGTIAFVEVRNGISDLSAVATTWRPVDPTVLWVSYQSRGEDILVQAEVNARNSAVGGGIRLDVFVANWGVFLSSLSAIPLTNGLWSEVLGSSYHRKRAYTFLWQYVPADTYKLQLWWSTYGAGTAFFNYTNTINHFLAKGYGYG